MSRIKNLVILKRILWIDTLLGGVTALVGLTLFSALTHVLGLSSQLIVTVSVITLVYAVVAFFLATQKTISIRLLKLLVYANWAWTFVSILLFYTHYSSAKILGIIFLALPIAAVGVLAYLEGNQILDE